MGTGMLFIFNFMCKESRKLPKLEMLENKKLVLKSVLKRELKNIQAEDFDLEVEKFERLLKQLTVQTFGPLVVKSSGVNISESGKLTTDYELMIQAHDYKQYKDSFDLIERFEVPCCAYVRYEGNVGDLHYAHSKLDLHFYENDIESIDEVYSVMVEDSENHAVVDIFRPVKIS